MKDKCHNCGNETFEKRFVSLTIDREDKLYKIQNVPAKVCLRCEQKYFSPETYKSVYDLLNENNRKSVKIDAEMLEFA